jgi:transposase
MTDIHHGTFGSGEDVEMSESETMSKRRRRSFSPEFKAEVVALCHQPGRSVPSVSQDLGLSETAVRRWFNQAEIDGGARAGTTSAEAEELARVRKQLREVTEERDILARAVSFFAKGTR